jgi:hypothetical protein
MGMTSGFYPPYPIQAMDQWRRKKYSNAKKNRSGSSSEREA